MIRHLPILLTLFICVACTNLAFSQVLSGSVHDVHSGESLIGVTIQLKGATDGTITDVDGNFKLTVKQATPFTLKASYIGYVSREIIITDITQVINIQLSQTQTALKEVNITDTRLTDKQRESPLTVESMDIIAIKQTPALSFYDGLGALKGVDLTSASLGFKIINTRGFNSTSPVRSLQLIDGVDNQAPGLNFSLGNFLGTSDLDVLKVDLIEGASSAFYGPNAFNGVVSMTTRSPFVKPGFEISVKSGSRDLLETAMRYAVVLKNKSGEDKFGMKFNAYVFKANDWVADNRAATPQSKSDTKNPGGYDAVNVYGDEYFTGGDFSSVPSIRPGINILYRTGYAEKDLVDYNTRNMKLEAAFYYKISKETEIIYASNFGTGTTVYQGDNRYSLKDILFFQNRLEIKKTNKYFLRFYTTDENAGNSYDAFFTAILLQNAAKSDNNWVNDYTSYFSNGAINGTGKNLFTKLQQLPGYPQANQYANYSDYLAAINPFLLNNFPDTLKLYHAGALNYANGIGNTIHGGLAYFQPGTAAFDSALKSITSKESFSQGGSKFFDRSSLFHVQGEYKFNFNHFDLTTGGNERIYTPDSRGTIFSDTSGRKITNYEYGLYGGLDFRFFNNHLKTNVTGRVDKNQNFNYLYSKALSAIYSKNPKHTFRFSYSSAIRNPTLTDQYLYYRVGRATLLGNITGYDSLVTIPSLISALNNGAPDSLSYFNVAPVKPEKVQTIEGGYRASLFNHVYLDGNIYYSIYRDFIGYKIGGKVTVIKINNSVNLDNVYRIASNSADVVTTAGASLGLNYFFANSFTINGNWSWNELDRHNSKDPLIPAYNTPKHKYNLGFSGNNITDNLGKNWGFSINYKYVEGYLFEGSPQFTGDIKSYGLIDVQFTKKFTETKTTMKLGASNLLDNQHYEVYGGPLVGRIVYFQLTVELN